jgi:sugar lactone lactonase YvrE
MNVYTSTVSLVTTLAGSGTPGFADDMGAAAFFRSPEGVAVDATGNVYVADSDNNRIRKVTPAGAVTTLAGSGAPGFADGTGASATFYRPAEVAVDTAGNVYVTGGSDGFRKVTPTGVVSRLVASIDACSVAVDTSDDIYLGAAYGIQKLTSPGVVTTVAGSGSRGFVDGNGSAAMFDSCSSGIAVDTAGNVYVADSDRIRKVTPAGVVMPLAGSGATVGVTNFANGAGATAMFNGPSGVAVDAAGNVYVADSGNNRIRKVTAAGVVTTFAGSGYAAFSDGAGGVASFNKPWGVAVDGAGNVYVGDLQNNRIRKIRPVGPGQLGVSWSPPSKDGGSPITNYTASARATGQPTLTCATTGSTSCIISGLTAGFAYGVTVTATNAVGTSVPSSDSGGFGGGDITKAVPTPGCGMDAGQGADLGTLVRYTVQTTGTKAADCADTDCGSWSYLREYYVKLPTASYDNLQPYPLLIEGPGCGGRGNNLYALPDLANSMIRVGLSPSADAQAFHSTNPNQGCFDDAEGDDSVDFAFYEQLYDQLAGQFCFDRNRVFVAGNEHAAKLMDELACKYAGDATRPVRGVLSNAGGLPTDPRFVPTCTTRPMAGIWVNEVADPIIPFSATIVAINRAMQVDGCTIGTGFVDAQFDTFPIGGGNSDTTCQKIRGCPDLTPLVVCKILGNYLSPNAAVVNPGFSTFVKLFENAPLLTR